ncbi:MAG: hypothetical protein JWO77_3833 [Ilumatobacteraceae bacterium]|nr:hypothetical protein [Ilumatobacteraceae bacterium]
MDTTTAPSTSTSKQGRLLRGVTVAAAVAVAVGGLLHLRTWNSDYREIPDGAVPGLWVVKAGFPANALLSVLVAAALVAIAFGALGRIHRLVLAAGLILEMGSIAALVASRGPGIFGWSETGYEGSAVQILVVEAIAVVLLTTALVVGRTIAGDRS